MLFANEHAFLLSPDTAIFHPRRPTFNLTFHCAAFRAVTGAAAAPLAAAGAPAAFCADTDVCGAWRIRNGSLVTICQTIASNFQSSFVDSRTILRMAGMSR